MEPACLPRTIEEIYKDYKGRRDGLVKALTSGESSLSPPLSLSLSLSLSVSVYFQVTKTSDYISPLPFNALDVQMLKNSTINVIQVCFLLLAYKLFWVS
jgi:hypothetical protein